MAKAAAPTEDPTAADAGDAPASPSARAKLVPIAAVAVAALAGAGLGGFLVGPRLAGGSGAAKEEPAEGHDEPAEAGHKGPARMVRVDNIVVNPAGSEGLRFLMVSVAFEVFDPEAESRLKEAEIQIRDVVTGVFERQPMAVLTRPGARDSLRLELASAVKAYAGKTPIRVYLPQFVIQ